MRPIRLLVLTGLILPALIFVPAARAQSTGTPPAARALLPASALATLLQNSVHLAGTVNIGAAGVQAGSVAVSGDFAWQSQVEGSLHLQSSSPAITAALGAATVDLVVVGQKAALRVGTGAWQCSGGTSSTPGTTKKSKASAKTKAKSAKKSKKAKTPVSGSVSGSATAMVQALPQFGQPVNLGAETLDGVSVWHVLAKSTGSTTTTATVDAYIIQSDLTLKRIAVTAATTSSPAMSVAATVDFSQYGEPVSVSLPSACATSARTMSSSEQTLLRTVRGLLQPRSLLALLVR